MNVNKLFAEFENKRVLVIGDVMIDAYLMGKVNRISPEAPVPIVSLTKHDERLGGAANVALNLVALGAKPIICSCVGTDKDSNTMIKLLEEASISAEGLVHSDNRMTTVKTRVIGNHQHLLRIDAEQTHAIDEQQEDELIQKVEVLAKAGLDAIIFEDYNKGVLTPKVIRSVIEIAKKYEIVTTVDPKKDNFLEYKGVTLFKPNLKELKEGTGFDFDYATQPYLFHAALEQLNASLQAEISFVTLSEHGVFIQREHEMYHCKAHLRNISDVSGAGDTVISVATLCLLAGADLHAIAEISNIAGGLVCEESGVVSIDKEKLINEINKLVLR